jgi:hypothetical protein
LSAYPRLRVEHGFLDDGDGRFGRDATVNAREVPEAENRGPANTRILVIDDVGERDDRKGSTEIGGSQRPTDQRVDETLWISLGKKALDLARTTEITVP